MDEYVPINCLRVGKTYSQVFMISSVAEKVSKKSSQSYLLVTLKDVTGSMIGPVWDLESKNILIPGTWVSMTIGIEDYNGKPNFVLKKMTPFIGEPENINDYVFGANDNIINTFAGVLNEKLSDIEDPFYRDVLNNANEHVHLIEVLKSSPYGTDGKWSHRGGLLLHTHLMLRMALENYQAIKDNIDVSIDKSLVIAGALLRNIGYASTTRQSGSKFIELDSYRLLGIRAASLLWCNHILISTESDLKVVIPEPKKLALQNICFADDIDQCASAEANLIYMVNKTIDMLYLENTQFYDHSARA